MMTAAGCVVITLAVAVPGCAPRDAAETRVAADCSSQVRANGVVYTSHSYTEHEASRYATAQKAECHDVGEDAAGSVFPDDPREVTTWTFKGYPPEDVLGARFDMESWAVFIADRVSREERNRIFEALSKPHR